MSDQPIKKSYFGLAALLTGIFAILALGANFGVAFLNITPALFGRLNVVTALFYCVLTPLAFTLGFVGMIFKNDSKILSAIAMTAVTIPFLIIFIQFVLSILRNN